MIKMTPELFNKFANKQEELDSMIREKHDISIDDWKWKYDTNHMIALRVEKAEFANVAFDSWKYWKQKAINHDRIIDEAVDVIHFIHLIINKQKHLTTEQMVDSINFHIENLKDGDEYKLLTLVFLGSETGLLDSYAILLTILNHYNFTLDDIEQAYDRKNAINHDRQHHNY